MNIDKEIWTAVTSILESTLPECEVSRSYDPEKRLKALESYDQTQVLVCLAGKVSTMISQTQVRDDYDFRVFVVDYISSRDDTSEEDELDELLAIPPMIYDAFAYKTHDVVNGSETMNIKLMAGEGYEAEYLTTYETFCACITLKITNVRTV